MTVILKTGRFDIVDPAVKTESFSFVLHCLHC